MSGRCREIQITLSEPFEFPDGTYACDIRVNWLFNNKVEKKLQFKRLLRQSDAFSRFEQIMDVAKNEMGKILKGEEPKP